MAAHPERLLRHLRRLVLPPSSDPATDAGLLDKFVRCNDEDAFAALVARHGPMVFGVCRRVLRDAHQAEDVAQATFLLLAAKARTIRRADALATWLHRTAQHLALKCRLTDTRRRQREMRSLLTTPALAQPDPLDELSIRELLAIFDEELQRLRTGYRLPLILCCLEGHTQEEAARQLGWTPGAVKGRLERGRAQLHRRLVKRGVSLTAVLVALEGLHGMSSAHGMPPGFVIATLLAAARFTATTRNVDAIIANKAMALAEEAVRGMAVGKTKIIFAILLAVSVAVAGVGALARQGLTARQREEKHLAETGVESKEVEQPKQVQEKQQARTDSYGDPLPPGALVRMGTIRLRPAEGGKSTGSSSAFLPGGNVLITEGYKSIRFWEVATGKEIYRIEAPGGGTWSFALSPDGKVLAASCFDKTIRLWDIATSKEILRLSRNSSALLAFSHDGRKLVSDESGILHLWNLATGKEEVRTLLQQHYATHALAFTSGDKAIITWDYNRGVFYWDAASGKQLRRFTPLGAHLRRFSSPAGGVTSVAFSTDGKLLAVGCLDDTIRICEQTTGKELRSIESGKSAVASFSPDGKILVTSGDDGSILWDVASGQQIRKFSASGSCTIAPDGKTLALVGRFNGAIRLWDVATGKELSHAPGHENSVDRLAFSPDGRVLATRSHMDNTIRLWEAGTGRELHVLRHGDGLPMVFAADGKALVSGGWDGMIRFWDTGTGKEILKIDIDKEKPSRHKWDTIVDALDFSQDGRTLFSSGHTSSGQMGPGAARIGLIQVWAAATGNQLLKQKMTLPSNYGEISFSPDRKFLIFEEGGIVLWDIHRNKKRLTLLPPKQHGIGCTAFSPEGKILAAITYEARPRVDSSNRLKYTLRLWELTTGQELLCIPTSDPLIDALAFSPNGRVVACGCDEAIRLWDVATARELLRLHGHGVRVHRLAYAPDGRTLASGLADSTTLIWDLKPETWHAGMPAKDLSARDLEHLWSDLAGADAAKAHQALWTLAADPDKTAAFLKEHLPPTPEEKQNRIQQLVADLDSRQFAVREQVSRQLQELSSEAEPALMQALERKPSAEVRKRIDTLLDLPQTVRSAETLRRLRAIQLLEHLKTKKAEQNLESLAQGAPLAVETQEARAALDRLRQRKGD